MRWKLSQAQRSMFAFTGAIIACRLIYIWQAFMNVLWTTSASLSIAVGWPSGISLALLAGFLGFCGFFAGFYALLWMISKK